MKNHPQTTMYPENFSNNIGLEETNNMELPPKVARLCRSPKRISKLSEDSDDQQPHVSIVDLSAKSSMERDNKPTTKQSQRLPLWAWFCIAKALGIPLHNRDKPIFATILHIITFGSALTFTFSQIWFITYDIASKNTKEDILSGTVSILLTLMWTSLGLYAKSLTGRLFRHRQFLKDIRMHARTIFKVNAAFLVFFLGLIFIIMQNLSSVYLLDARTCQKIEVEVIVCQLQFFSRVIYSVFFLIWNTLVAIVLISLCRTHTIGIRRFVRELELDALVKDHYYAKEFQIDPMTKEDVCEETFWLEEDSSFAADDESSKDSQFVLVNRKPRPQFKESPSEPSSTPCSINDENRKIPTISLSDENLPSSFTESTKMKSSSDSELELKPTTRSDFNEKNKFIPIQSGNFENNTGDNISITPHSMTNAEILHKYWKLSCRLRVTSCALQRWMASLISLIIVWCFIYLIRWQDHTPTVPDVVLFVMPLLILPLLSSAFAEVNMEGCRMIQCICPTEERLQLIRFLCQNPLNMMIFGVSLSYSTIMTVVFAIFVAFTSRLIFSEMSKTQS